MKAKKQKILTLREAKERGCTTFEFPNGDYSYMDNDGVEHLIRRRREIARGSYVFSYRNGDYRYEKDGIEYLIKNNY